MVLHVWGLDFGLPQAVHPDEPVPVTRAQRMVAENDLDPKGFHWPSLQTYILAAEYKLWYWYGDATGAFNYPDLDDIPGIGLPDRFVAHTFRQPFGYYYAGRFTTVLFSAGLIWIFYLLALRFFKPSYAVVAAGLLALNPIVHASGRYIVPDIPTEFFFIAALYFMDRLYASLLVKNLETENLSPVKLTWLTALMIGLATGTKYPAAVLAVPLIAVLLFPSSGYKFGYRLSLAIQTLIIIPAVFLITTPYALLDASQFVHDIRTIGHHVQDNHIGMQFSGSILLKSAGELTNSCGWLWTTFGIIGLFAFFGRLKRTWPLLIAFFITLAGILPLTVFADRYLIPLIPFLIFGIVSLFSLLEGLDPQLSESKKQRILIFAIAGMIVAGITGAYNLCIDSQRLTLPHTRLLALEWIEDNIPSGSIILKEQGAPDLNNSDWLPLVSTPWYDVTEITPMFSREGPNRDPLDVIFETKPEWVITSSNVRGRYEREGVEEEFPDLVAAFSIYYILIDDHLELVQRFAPGSGANGDEIVIYRVPDGLWERVVLEPATISDILGE